MTFKCPFCTGFSTRPSAPGNIHCDWCGRIYFAPDNKANTFTRVDGVEVDETPEEIAFDWKLRGY